MESFIIDFLESNQTPKVPQSLEHTKSFSESLSLVLNVKENQKSREAINFAICSTLSALFQNISYIVDQKSNLYCGILGSTGSGKSYACEKVQSLIDFVYEDDDFTSIVPKTSVGFLKQIHYLSPLKSFAIFFEEMIKYKISDKNYESFFNIALSLFESKTIRTHASLNALKNHDLPNTFKDIVVSIIWNSTLIDLENSYAEGAFNEDFFGRNLIFIMPSDIEHLNDKTIGLFQIELLSNLKKRFYQMKKNIDLSLLSHNLYEMDASNFFNLSKELRESLNQQRKTENKEYSEFARTETIIKRLFNNIVLFEALMNSVVITNNEIVEQAQNILKNEDKVSDIFNYCKHLAFKSIHNIKNNSSYFSNLEGVEQYPKKILRNCTKIEKKYKDYIERCDEAVLWYVRSMHEYTKDFNKIYHEAMGKSYRKWTEQLSVGEQKIRDEHIPQGYVSRTFLINIVKDKRMLDSCLDYFREKLGDDLWEIKVPIPTNQNKSITFFRFDFFDGRWRVDINPKPFLFNDDRYT